MKKFEVMFMRVSNFATPQQQKQLSIYFCKQNYFTDNNDIKIAIPDGYQIISITELLPDVTQPTLTTVKN